MSKLLNKKTKNNLIDRLLYLTYYGLFLLVWYQQINYLIFYFFPVIMFLVKLHTGFKNNSEKFFFAYTMVFHTLIICDVFGVIGKH